jgi:nicotinamide phosphoribosyltransferase
MNPMLLSDAYKQSHKNQYPEGTSFVYSNFTPRSDGYAKTKGGVVVFGIQAFLQKLHKWFYDDFFSQDKEQVIKEFSDVYFNYFGSKAETEHLEELHDLGYLPILIKALPEGTICPIGVPVLTIENTIGKFFWVTNFLETIMSTELWLSMTSATIAHEYKNILTYWSEKTCDNNEHIPFQAHDFSMRGMSGIDAAMASGAGHLLSFMGSDTIPAVYYLKEYYGAQPEKEMVACSIPATEHSVMSMGTKDDEIGTFRKLITDIYPSGIMSVVSDTWDLWKVITEYLPKLKDEIMARDGKVVIRPDSGDPADIICGTLGTKMRGSRTPIEEGVIELLWDIFGGTVNEKGYKVLDPHIGAIYGDSITLERANDICKRLDQKGFASSNIVFGVGSFTYQFNTRDTYGFAMKATAGMVDGNYREIFKDPVTDDGVKKSLRGFLAVRKDENGKYYVKDGLSYADARGGELTEVYYNGLIQKYQSFSVIKQRLNK